MRRFWGFAAATLAFFLLLFLIAEALRIPVLADPDSSLGPRGAAAALTGFFLLVIDALLPVPSSLVMIAHGALFGVVAGTALSLAGSLGAAAVGFALGRAGGPLFERVIGPQERLRAERLLERWGVFAVVVTRPVPLLAETVAVVAGATGMRFRMFMAAALFGALPAAALYAWAGASGATGLGAWPFIAVLAIAGLLLAAGIAWDRLGRSSDSETL